jgi:hypothetical protein
MNYFKAENYRSANAQVVGILNNIADNFVASSNAVR